jgi:nitrate/nitrite transporter NarK
VALLVATVLLVICWLAALTFGLAAQTAFVQAAVLLLVVTALTGIAGGAFLNSALAIRHWRSKRPNDRFPPIAGVS